MDNGYRSGSIQDAAQSYAETKAKVYAADKPREPRAIEGQINAAHRMIDISSNIMSAMDDLRGRLLGISEPNAPPSARDGGKIEAVRAELPELSMLLERLEQQLGAMANKFSDLQRI